MAYNNEYYKKALSIIENNKKLRNKEYEAALRKLHAEVPELSNIETRLSIIGAKAMKAAALNNQEELKSLEKESIALQEQKNEILNAAKIEAPENSCSLCGDTGYNGTQLCECVKHKAKELVFKDLSIKSPIANQNFSTFSLDYYEGEDKETMAEILEFSKRYADNFTTKSESLLFLGEVGLGKTHLSLAIINAVIEKGYGAIYDSAQNLFSQIEKEHFSFSGNAEKLDAVLSCDLLVLDDLGTEFSSSFTVSTLYNIINTRINNQLPTIINTNYGLAEIETAYTPRVLSRIMGNYKTKKFAGKDIRIIKAFG